jgi:hypothetical protein
MKKTKVISLILIQYNMLYWTVTWSWESYSLLLMPWLPLL